VHADKTGQSRGASVYNPFVITSFFATDLHGSLDRYEALFAAVARERPRAVFLGGDLMPHGFLPAARSLSSFDDFLVDFVAPRLADLKKRLGENYPEFFVLLGNDDGLREEATVLEIAGNGLWHYAHNRKYCFENFTIYGYANVPPTPFLGKDWERYDVSRYVPPGSVSPEEGYHSSTVDVREIRFATIEKDLASLVGEDGPENAVFLFHTPPSDTALDRAAMDGKKIDHVPLDLHVGSVAVRRLIENRQPLLTLHGHIHESARITGKWLDRIGDTVMYNGSHDGPELSLITFDLEKPGNARRLLL
jgi:Icc-related predicted phosphoesterase